VVELYDADHASNQVLGTGKAGPPANRPVDPSARANPLVGGDRLIGGFICAGTASKTLLIRAGGLFLGLMPVSVLAALRQSTLMLYDAGTG